ncbi:GtrA family protein [Vogesella oryzae]|uniref:GtrA family protein n=1 Tax=Vogesella oryzae TaxID=1735285 RepID=UPI0015813F16|nr:GtrA family protein [Vogesella oryzae]
MSRLFKQASWFIVVGCAAAATHWLIAVLCVELAHLPPLLANVVGWLTAFVVSFSGHYRLTFRHQRVGLWHACRRFFLVSAGGFAVNEAAYALLLRLQVLRYDVLLFLLLLGMAVITFLLSRYWVFRSKPA